MNHRNGSTPVTDETAVEREIQAKGLTAPRITPDHIDSRIVGETYTVLPSGKVMVCELTLRNGFTVRGDAAVVSVANFDEGIGRRISRENARNKIWELEGYLLQSQLNNADKSELVPPQPLGYTDGGPNPNYGHDANGSPVAVAGDPLGEREG